MKNYLFISKILKHCIFYQIYIYIYIYIYIGQRVDSKEK